MLSDVEIIETTMQPSAVIHLTIPRDEIQTAMGPAFQELFATIAEQGIGVAGAVFSHHFEMHPATFDFELGVPVSSSIIPSGRVAQGELPGVKVARTVYQGPYEGLGNAWGEFQAAVSAAGYSLKSNLWEGYETGPESGLEASEFRTVLYQPID